MSFIHKILKSKLWLLWLLLLSAIIIIISSYQFGKLDLTQEKRYTLSNATKEMLGNLKEDIEVEVLLDGELSSGFKKLKIATKELLDEYRDYSKGKLHFIIHKPGEGLTDSAKLNLYDSLVRLGIKPFNNQIKEKDEEAQTERLIFPAALVKTNERMYAVDLMSGKSGYDEESTLNYSEALLEFKFDDAIGKLTKTDFPIVAYAAGNEEPLNPSVRSLFDIMRNNYRFGVMDLNTGILNADTIKALLIVKPAKAFTEQEKIKIDQYIMQGGKVVWLIDKLEASFDSLLRKKSDFVAYDKGLNLDDILFKYGVRINPDLLQDLNCARQPLVVGSSGGKPQIERVPFPYYPLLTSPSNHPISKNLDFVLSVFPSSIDTVKSTGVQKTILLSSDTSSRTLGTPAMVSLQSVASDDDLKTFNKSHVPVAILLEGKFNSLYANRFTNEMNDSVQKLTGAAFLTASKPTQQIVISDADLITNVVTESKGTLPMGTQQFEEYTFANKDFFINCMDYLVGNAGIMQTRNKEVILRLLNKHKLQETKTLWQIVNIGLPVLLIVGLGLTLQWQRRKRFAA